MQANIINESYIYNFSIFMYHCDRKHTSPIKMRQYDVWPCLQSSTEGDISIYQYLL